MRRLAQHALAGVGFAAVVTAASVVGLSSPAVEGVAIAVPAGSGVVRTPSATSTPVDREKADHELRLAMLRARKNDLAARAADRARVAAAKQATGRTKLLAVQTREISVRHRKLQAEKAALKRALANRGYEPGTTDPREMARQILKNKYGYGGNQFDCFNNIIMRESMWRVNATNPSSGAYGIPQALPGSKMATVASDWRTNPATQIIWGIEYMKNRYGSPCAAWGFKSSHGWY
ncbi:MAG TPA: transglycosylase SLT domain-containing protein [Propionibacteriaceae bacterium]|nr:transglycosylase SLT domain-containing protein [Propionibacteriaceae bacterium]